MMKFSTMTDRELLEHAEKISHGVSDYIAIKNEVVKRYKEMLIKLKSKKPKNNGTK